jgi:hypothetical protein
MRAEGAEEAKQDGDSERLLQTVQPFLEEGGVVGVEEKEGGGGVERTDGGGGPREKVDEGLKKRRK